MDGVGHEITGEAYDAAVTSPATGSPAIRHAGAGGRRRRARPVARRVRRRDLGAVSRSDSSSPRGPSRVAPDAGAPTRSRSSSGIRLVRPAPEHGPQLGLDAEAHPVVEAPRRRSAGADEVPALAVGVVETASRTAVVRTAGSSACGDDDPLPRPLSPLSTTRHPSGTAAAGQTVTTSSGSSVGVADPGLDRSGPERPVPQNRGWDDAEAAGRADEVCRTLAARRACRPGSPTAAARWRTGL